MHLYLKVDSRGGRSLVLTTSFEDERAFPGCPSKALVFRALNTQTSQVMVEFLPKSEVDLSTAIPLTTRKVKGCLGIINVANGWHHLFLILLTRMHVLLLIRKLKFCVSSPPSFPPTDIFVAVILSATDIGNTRPAAASPEIVARIHDVGFFCLNSSAWDELGNGLGPDAHSGYYSDQINDTALRDQYTYSSQQNQVLEHPCAPLMKILSSGTFYYAPAPQWDISSRLSLRNSKDQRVESESVAYDGRFVWNEYIVQSLLDLRSKLDPNERDEMDRCQFIVCFPNPSLCTA